MGRVLRWAPYVKPRLSFRNKAFGIKGGMGLPFGVEMPNLVMPMTMPRVRRAGGVGQDRG